MTALPSLRQLRYLLALAEHLNFTKAAEVCFVSQSTLSTGLKELENTLGVQLVERSKQAVALTSIGQAIVERARHVITAAEDLRDFAFDAALPMKATLRLGLIPTIAPFVLPRVMPLLAQKFPDLQLALREDLTGQLLERLRNRQLDFALIALPYDTQGLHVQALYKDKFWLVGRPGDPALARKSLAHSRDWTDRLLLLEEGHCLRDHALRACRTSELASVPGIEATSLLTLVQMVASGMGIALLPAMAIDSGLLQHLSLSAKPLVAPAPAREIALVTRTTSAHMAEFEAIAKMLCVAQPKPQ
jgi:LysR family hydrogen peroxide-inducible transcriptional activator